MIRLAWGRRGARDAAARGDVVVVVDVLRFSSTAVIAVAHGGVVVPRPWEPSKRVGSLSPLAHMRPGRWEISSPNGALCCQQGGRVLVGALLNAAATARALADETDVTVIACGERWPDHTLRVALEDYLGAGAILHALWGTAPNAAFAPEATVAARAFDAARADLAELIAGCPSGRELIEDMDRAADVPHCTQLDRYDTVVGMCAGELLEGKP